MDFDTFLRRFYDDLWLVLFIGAGLLFWVAAIRRVVKGQGLEALLPLLAAAVITSILLASKAFAVLGR